MKIRSIMAGLAASIGIMMLSNTPLYAESAFTMNFGTVVAYIFLMLCIFAAGTAFSKTDILQAAIFEAIIIGEIVSLQVGIGIFIGVIAGISNVIRSAKNMQK